MANDINEINNTFWNNWKDKKCQILTILTMHKKLPIMFFSSLTLFQNINEAENRQYIILVFVILTRAEWSNKRTYRNSINPNVNSEATWLGFQMTGP